MLHKVGAQHRALVLAKPGVRLSQKVFSDKNNIPSSGSDAGAGVRRGEMEPLFLLLLRRFHVRHLADGGMS